MLDENFEQDWTKILDQEHRLSQAKHHYQNHPMKGGYTPVHHLYKLPLKQNQVEYTGAHLFMHGNYDFKEEITRETSDKEENPLKYSLLRP